MTHEKFDPSKLEKLNDPARLARMEPQRIWDAAGIANPCVVVEIGAGTGIFAEAFTNFAPEAPIYAVDTEPLMIGWMEAHRAPALGGRLIPLLATDEGVPLWIDFATCTDAYFNVTPEPATLALLAAGACALRMLRRRR